MTYFKIHSEERRRQEDAILRSWHCSTRDRSAREYAECIAARTSEARKEMERRAR